MRRESRGWGEGAKESNREEAGVRERETEREKKHKRVIQSVF